MPARWSALTIPLNSRTCSPARPVAAYMACGAKKPMEL